MDYRMLTGLLTLGVAACDGGVVSGGSALAISKYDAVDIVEAGGGVTVSATNMSKYDLTDIAKAAVGTNARIVVVDAGALSKYDMVDIGKAGPGLVIFQQ